MDRPLTDYQPLQIAEGEEPVFLVMRTADVTEWWLDNDMTRYHAITVEVEGSGTILVAAYPTERDQHRWAILTDSTDAIAWSYLREKLGLVDGDGPGMSRLLAKALRREIFHVPGVDLPPEHPSRRPQKGTAT
jgi:hypothetical protein